MKLAQLAQDPALIMTRTFWFPPDSLPEDRFKVTINHLSSSLFTETQEKAKVKYAGGRKNRESDFSLAQFRKVLVDEVLMRAIVKIEGLTLGKLRRLVVLDAQAVGEAGGLGAAVPADPTLKDEAMQGLKTDSGEPLSDEQKKELAVANIKFLLLKSNEFMDWVLDVCSNLSYYQDEEWEQRVGNSASGGSTNSA